MLSMRIPDLQTFDLKALGLIGQILMEVGTYWGQEVPE